jgi:hypothetical protein
MSALAMHMAVIEFFLGRGAHIADGDVKMERHAGERMIPVNGDLVADDLGDDDCLLSKFTLGVELHSLFKLFSAFDLIGGNYGDILRIVNAVSFLGRDANFKGVTSFLALHGLFEAGDDLSFALDVGEWFAACGGVDDVLVVVGECVIENNNRASGDLHKKSGLGAEDSAGRKLDGQGQIASAKDRGFTDQ